MTRSSDLTDGETARNAGGQVPPRSTRPEATARSTEFCDPKYRTLKSLATSNPMLFRYRRTITVAA